MDPMQALEDGSADPMDALEADGEQQNAVLPRRADEFEQEAEREVEASKGLGGEAEEGKMKLVHQVRHQVSPACSRLTFLFAFVYRSMKNR